MDNVDIPYLDVANMILHLLLNKYINVTSRNIREPPPPTNNAEEIVSRFLKFKKASVRANTAPPTEEQKQIQYERSILYSTPINQAINLKHNITKEKTSALKLGIDKIFVSSIRKSMTKDQVLSNYVVLSLSIVISKKEEARIARKR